MPYRQPVEPVRLDTSRPSIVIPLSTAIAIVVIVVLVIVAAASRSAAHARVSGTVGEHERPTGAPRHAAAGELEAPATALPLAGTRFVGTATWYCSTGQYGSPRSACPRGHGPGEMFAAIDRKDSTFRKGDRVRVRYGSRSVVVRIVDVCACVDRRVIDLSVTAFVRLAGYGPNGWALGVLPVTLEAAGSRRTVLPATDVAR